MLNTVEQETKGGEELPQKEGQQQDNNKIHKQYEECVSKMISLTRDKNILYKSKLKIKNVEIGTLIDELFKEEQEAERVALKEQIKDALKSHVEFSQFKDQKMKEIQDAFTNKEKEIIKIFNAVFKKIENINIIHTDFLSAAGALENSQQDQNQQS